MVTVLERRWVLIVEVSCEEDQPCWWQGRVLRFAGDGGGGWVYELVEAVVEM